MKYIVYITKNTVNGKVYIGVHGTENPEVFDGYLGNSCYANYPSTYNNPKYPFQYAVKKYGPGKFIRTTIKVFDTADEAFQLEATIVDEKCVMSKYTYNVFLGGKGANLPPKTIYQYSISGKFLREWEVKEAARMYSFNSSSIYASITHKQKLAGFYWSDIKVDQLNMEEYSKPNIPKTIYEYDSEGYCIGVYESLHEFENPGKVCTAISTRKAYKGNYYSYSLVEKFEPYKKNHLRNTTIYIYDKDGKYFNSANSLREAANLVGGKSASSVSDSLASKKPYKSFRFTTEKVESMEKLESTNIENKPVEVFDLYGNKLNEYSSVNKLIKDLHLDSSTVHRVIKGTARQTKGYIIKYKR